MKQILLIMLILVSGQILSAQVPSSFSYQGIARDEKGQPYANREIALRLSILSSPDNPTSLFTETKKVTTNAQGLFSVLVNDAGNNSNFILITWSNGQKYLKTEIDPLGGTNFKTLGVTKLQSVPFALLSSKVQFPIHHSETNQASLITLSNSEGRALHATSYVSNAIEAHSHSTSSGAAIKGIAHQGNSIAVSAESIGDGLALKVSGKVQLSGGNLAPGAGKVLTSDAEGNATWQKPVGIAFRASGMVNDWPFKIQSGAWRKVLFYQTARYNYGNSYDAPNALFFPPETGVYHLNAQILWLSIRNTTIMRMMLLRNGVTSELAIEYSAEQSMDNNYVERVSKLSLDIMLQKNDVIWVEAYQSNPGGYQQELSNAGQFSWFSGHLVYKP